VGVAKGQKFTAGFSAVRIICQGAERMFLRHIPIFLEIAE